jgi:hypothetical protein
VVKADFLQGILTPADTDALMEAGPIALHGKGMGVLHHCDARMCIRQSHLHLGANAENSKDRRIHGKAGRKLTIEQVEEIRRDYRHQPPRYRGMMRLSYPGSKGGATGEETRSYHSRY